LGAGASTLMALGCGHQGKGGTHGSPVSFQYSKQSGCTIVQQGSKHKASRLKTLPNLGLPPSQFKG